jgi:threonine dehydrogenase-like Zn-dependent dehydrogenase
MTMRALTVQPGTADSARLRDVPADDDSSGSLLIETLAIGICGTDIEIVQGEYGWLPPGDDYLILGHEALGRVLAAPAGSDVKPGDLVVPMVRHPDPVPCPNCAVGEWDMCRNGQYTEHGIKERHGFAREQFRLPPHRVVKIDPRLEQLGVLLEPASVLAKAWEHIERIGKRAVWKPQSVLVTGAGPIGLLAALMARQRGLEVDVVDIVTDGPKPQLVRDLGARYHSSGVKSVDQVPNVALECTGVAQLVFDVMQVTAPGGIVCLTGVSSGGREISVDLGSLNRSMVLENDVIFGSVNANRRHYEAAAAALAHADREWLGRLITRRVPLDQWQQALTRQPDDVKVVIQIGS